MQRCIPWTTALCNMTCIVRACFSGVDASRLPGNDGAKARRRYERVALSTCIPAPKGTEQVSVTQLLSKTLLSAIELKTRHPATSEQLISDVLTRDKQHFSLPDASDAFRQVAQHLPSTYKEALTLVEDMGLLRWPRDYVYDMCSRCGFVYRCDHKSDRACPDCGRSRADAKHPALKLIVRTPIEYVRQVYRSKEAARLVKSWPSRRNPDNGKLVDVMDGALWKEQVDNDVSLRRADAPSIVDPRHLIVGIATDGFQVGQC